MENKILHFLHTLKREINEEHLFDTILELNKSDLKEFIAKRISYSHNLENALSYGIKASQELGYTRIAQELQKNLNDEQGMINGEYDSSKAHKNWRNDFISALGIKDFFDKYNENLYDICGGNYYEFLGQIVFIEFIIPIEFHFIKRGIEKNNIELTAQDKLYLDDHIYHDAIDHLPDLLDALNNDILSKNNIDAILSGIKKGLDDKRKFYQKI